MTRDDERAFEQLAQRNGTTWIFDQLQNLVGPQLVLLYLANSLGNNPANADDSRRLFELIQKLDEQYGFHGSLDSALWDLHANGYPMEPKPQVIQAFKLNFGERTEAVLESLRRRGHKIEGETLSVLYPPGSDGYIGTEAADLDEEIGILAAQHGVERDDLQIEPVWGLGPRSA